MKTDVERLLYFIGTGLLIIAVFEVTFLPYFLYRFCPDVYIPYILHRQVVGGIYALAFLFYVFCDKIFMKQLKTILVIFLLYCLFQIIVQQVG